MKLSMVIVAAASLVAFGAQAQGTVRGAQEGADNGASVAGPLGAIVGGAVGAATGTVGGLLGVQDGPRFRTYVQGERVPSYRYNEDVRVGGILPESGVTYYDVPPEYHVRDYRYTVVNGETVLVDPRTRRIVEVVR